MALDPTPLAEASTYPASINGPLANSQVSSADVSNGLEKLGNRTRYLTDTKVNRAGDDNVTGRITIVAGASNTAGLVATGNGTGYGVSGTGGSNGGGGIFTAGIGGNNIGCYGLGRGTQPGVQGLGGLTGAGGDFAAGGGNAAGVLATGSGTGDGITATGGATGKGGTFAAGGGNADGLSATASGTGSGVSCTGGTTGPGITATPGTASTDTVPQCAGKFAGFIEITADDPAAGVAPPADRHVIYGLSVAKAYCTVTVGAGGPYFKADSHNVAVVDDVVSGIYEVTFSQPMPTANYTVVLSISDATLGVSWSTKTANGFRFTVHAGGVADGTIVTVDFVVFGRR